MLITGCSDKNKETEDKIYNTNEAIKEIQKIDGLKYELVSLEYLNGISTVKIRVTNEKERIQNLYINIELTNEDKKELLLGYIEELDKEESTLIVSNIEKDLTKMTNIKYEVRK